MGSRFCSEAESRYSPVEGKALGVAWGRHREQLPKETGREGMSILVQGFPYTGNEQPHCQRSVAGAGGSPGAPRGGLCERGGPSARRVGEPGSVASECLVLAGARPELMRPKEIRECEELQEECLETRAIALIMLQAELNGVRLLTLGGVNEAAARDEEVSGVAKAIETGVWPQELWAYRQAELSLCVVDGVVLYGDRLVIPRSLHPEVLATLHLGHQGVSSMLECAGQSVWWPGLNEEVALVRERCLECSRNAPSQQKEPPARIPDVEYPFQMVCADVAQPPPEVRRSQRQVSWPAKYSA